MSKLLRSNLKNVDILDIDIGEQVMLANCELRYSFKPGSKTDDLLQSYNVEVTSINEIIKYGRCVVNKVLRSLLPIFRDLVRIELPYIIAPPVLMVSNKIRPNSSLSSRNLQDKIKKQFGKSIMYSINSKYGNARE